MNKLALNYRKAFSSIDSMSKLVLVRHGESIYNNDNKFTGWVDVPLSEKGILEAIKCAKKLRKIDLEIAFTSELERAQETLLIILSEQKKTGIFIHEKGKEKKWEKHFTNKKEILVHCNEALNERYYGDLQGKNKDAMRKKYGEEKVFLWRRSYDIRPPHGESLKDVCKRVVPYFEKKIIPELRKGNDVIVSLHGNSMRAIIKYIDKIADDKIPFLEMPFAKPIIYNYSKGKLTKAKHKHSFKRKIHYK